MSTAGQPNLFDPMQCDPLELVERGGAAAREMARWPQRLVELFELHRAFNLRRGMDPDRAAVDAAERVVLIAEYLGGRPVYLPRGDAIRRAVRDATIYASQGVPVEELARRHGMAVASVYEILEEQRRMFVDRMQGKLFEESGRRPQ